MTENIKKLLKLTITADSEEEARLIAARNFTDVPEIIQAKEITKLYEVVAYGIPSTLKQLEQHGRE